MDISNTTTLRRRLPHGGSRGSMHISLRLKGQSDLVVTSTMMKRRSDDHAEHHLASLIQTFIHFYTFW